MKIRTGFVSNSSSSSFVAIGFDITKYYESLETDEAVERLHDLSWENGFLILTAEDMEVSSGVALVKEVVDLEDYESKQFSVTDIQNEADKIKKELVDHLGACIETEPKLYAGVRSC